MAASGLSSFSVF